MSHATHLSGVGGGSDLCCPQDNRLIKAPSHVFTITVVGGGVQQNVALVTQCILLNETPFFFLANQVTWPDSTSVGQLGGFYHVPKGRRSHIVGQ